MLGSNQTYLRNLHRIIKTYEYAAENDDAESVVIDIASLERTNDSVSEYEDRSRLTEVQERELGLHNVTVDEMKADFFNIPGEDFPLVNDMSAYHDSVLNITNALLTNRTGFLSDTLSSDDDGSRGSISDDGEYEDNTDIFLFHQRKKIENLNQDRPKLSTDFNLNASSSKNEKIVQSHRSQIPIQDSELSFMGLKLSSGNCDRNLEELMQTPKNTKKEAHKKKEKVDSNFSIRVDRNKRRSLKSSVITHTSTSDTSAAEDEISLSDNADHLRLPDNSLLRPSEISMDKNNALHNDPSQIVNTFSKKSHSTKSNPFYSVPKLPRTPSHKKLNPSSNKPFSDKKGGRVRKLFSSTKTSEEVLEDMSSISKPKSPYFLRVRSPSNTCQRITHSCSKMENKYSDSLSLKDACKPTSRKGRNKSMTSKIPDKRDEMLDVFGSPPKCVKSLSMVSPDYSSRRITRSCSKLERKNCETKDTIMCHSKTVQSKKGSHNRSQGRKKTSARCLHNVTSQPSDNLCSPIRRMKLESPTSSNSNFLQVPLFNTSRTRAKNHVYDPLQSEDDISVEELQVEMYNEMKRRKNLRKKM
ncbi:uncharacterized protein LOC120328434 [Styela clava]